LKDILETDTEYVLTVACPACGSGEIKLSYLAKEGYEDDISIEWKGAGCDNLICANTFTFRKSSDLFKLQASKLTENHKLH
jgi:hypothetical protein